MEAMASGLSVGGYNAEGVRDSVCHEETGLLAPARDRALFTAHLRALLTSPERRLHFAQRARLHAERQSWETVMARLLEVYERVATHAPPVLAEGDPSAVA